MRKKTHKQYLEELWVKEIIDLPLENYKGSNTPILHECIRGHKTLRRPNNVLMGKKCQKCPIEATYEKYLTTIKNKGLTLVGNYVSMRTPIEHKCPSGHVFFISPDNALRSNTLGCKECSKNSFDKSKPASLYLIQFEVNKSVFYKLGIII